MADIHLINQGDSFPEVNLSVQQTPYIGLEKGRKHILIIGGGVSGLMTAWILLDKGYRVTIVAERWAWTEDWHESRLTSQIAGALWEFPPGGCGVCEIAKPDDPDNWATLQHYREWALQSYKFYKKFSELTKPIYNAEFGGSITQLHSFFYHPLTGSDPVNREDIDKYMEIKMQFKKKRIDGFEPGLRNILADAGVAENWRETLKGAYTYDAPIINTDKAMMFLMSLLRNKGAELVTKKIEESLETIGWDLRLEYSADAIVNATGLGAGILADDPDVFPVRGAIKRIDNEKDNKFKQTRDAYLVPCQIDDYGKSTKTIYIVPRTDKTLIIGSIIQRFNDKLDLTETSPEVEIM